MFGLRRFSFFSRNDGPDPTEKRALCLQKSVVAPSLRDLESLNAIQTLKRWATLNHASGQIVVALAEDGRTPLQKNIQTRQQTCSTIAPKLMRRTGSDIDPKAF